MAVSVVWSPEALEDLESIARYISKDSVFYAKTVVGKIRDVSRQLKDFPEMGRVVPELGDPNIRERFAYGYRIIYALRDSDVLVLAVFHGKRLLHKLD